MDNLQAPAGGYVHRQNIPSAFWTVNHNLGQKYVVVEVIRDDNLTNTGRYNYPVIDFADSNTLTVSFDYLATGVIVVAAGSVKGDKGEPGNIVVAGSYVHEQPDADAIWNIQHNLDTKYVVVELVDEYDRVITGKYDHPIITYIDENNIQAAFDYSVAGKAVVTIGGGANISIESGANVFLGNANLTVGAVGNVFQFYTGGYGNSNVLSYLNSEKITSANIGAFQTYANLTFSTVSNAAVQAVEINSLRANITAANAVITSLGGNAATQAAILDTLTSNAATQASTLDILNGNAATQAFTLTVLLGNAVAQQTSLIDLVANAATQAQLIANASGTTANLVNSSYTVSLGSTGNLTLPGGGIIDGSGYDIDLIAKDDGVATAGTVNITTNNPAIAQSFTWQFNSLGELELPQGGLIKEGGGPFGSTITLEPANITDGDQVLVVYPTAGEGNHLHLTTGNLYNTEMYLGSDDYYVKLTNTGTIVLNANDNASAVSQWQFASSGNITLPNNGTIGEIPNPSGFPGYSILLQPSGYINPNQQLLVYPTGGADFNHLHLTSGNLYDTELFLGNDNLYVKLANTGNVEIRADDNAGNVAQWTFGTDANLTLPETGYLRVGTGIVAGFASSPAPIISGFSSISAENFTFLANGVNILSAVGAGSYGNTQVASYLLNFDGDIEFTSSTARIGNVDVITVGDHIRSPSYQFSNGVNILSTVTATANLSALTSNIGWTAVGATPPTFTTTSNGTKIVLWPSISNTMVDYAIGIEAGNTWFSIPQATSNFGYKWYAGNTVIATLSGNGTLTTANLTATGNVVQQSAYYETYGNISNSGGNLTCNFNLGTTFYAALTANVTANFTNVNAIASTVTGATIIVDQGATAYRIANVQVNGVNQTVRWVGAVAGAGTASNTDIVSFSLIHLGGGAYRVLGQQSSYG